MLQVFFIFFDYVSRHLLDGSSSNFNSMRLFYARILYKIFVAR